MRTKTFRMNTEALEQGPVMNRPQSSSRFPIDRREIRQGAEWLLMCLICIACSLAQTAHSFPEAYSVSLQRGVIEEVQKADPQKGTKASVVIRCTGALKMTKGSTQPLAICHMPLPDPNKIPCTSPERGNWFGTAADLEVGQEVVFSGIYYSLGLVHPTTYRVRVGFKKTK